MRLADSLLGVQAPRGVRGPGLRGRFRGAWGVTWPSPRFAGISAIGLSHAVRVDTATANGGHDGGGAEPQLDLVASAADEPRAAERVRGAIERSTVIGWAGRHRRALSGLAVLLALAGAATGYVVTRPPAVDPVVDISIVGFSDFDSPGAGVQGAATRRYQATAHAAGDTDTLVGVVGPGLNHPTSSIAKVTFRLPQVGTLGATVDCSDSRWWRAKDADYRARVMRTDTHGRETTYDAPLGEGPLGHSNIFWHNLVRQQCLTAYVRTLAPAAASGSTVRDQVDIVLTLKNPSEHALWVSAPEYSDGLVEVTGGPWVAMPARDTTVLRMPIRAVDCAQGAPGVPVATTPQGNAGSVKALPVYVADEARPVEGQSVGVWVGIDHASAARLDSQIAALCPTS